MNLTAYVMDGHRIDIRPAPVERVWMEKTPQRYAYRCLPLNIANAHGWEILCPSTFTAVWNGTNALNSLRIQASPDTIAPALSHFGNGVLTFHIPCLFRTDPGYDLMVQGPINSPKDAIAPLCGIVETDWAPYTFTMNWIFTRPHAVIRFQQGEPFCHIFPIQRGAIESVDPEIKSLSENPALHAEYEAWNASRLQFNTDLKRPGSAARDEEWQKLYFRGVAADGTRTGVADHRTRLKLRPFRRDSYAAPASGLPSTPSAEDGGSDNAG